MVCPSRSNSQHDDVMGGVDSVGKVPVFFKKVLDFVKKECYDFKS
jgi:hypothetical protein